MIQNKLYKLTLADFDKGSQILGDAFIDYPTFEYLFPDLNERQKRIRHVMRFLLKCGLIHGEVLAPSLPQDVKTRAERIQKTIFKYIKNTKLNGKC